MIVKPLDETYLVNRWCRFEFMLLDIAAGHTLTILNIARLNHALECDEFKLEYVRLFQNHT